MGSEQDILPQSTLEAIEKATSHWIGVTSRTNPTAADFLVRSMLHGVRYRILTESARGNAALRRKLKGAIKASERGQWDERAWNDGTILANDIRL